MFKFTPIESRVKYSLVVQGDRNKTDPIFIANFYGLHVFYVNDILILNYDNIILIFSTIAIDKYEWHVITYTVPCFFYFNKLRIKD
jgi:hypothetical protein